MKFFSDLRVGLGKACLVAVLLIFALQAHAGSLEGSATSGEQTADATILTGSGYFHQLLIMPDGTNDVTVTIYDNTAASGTKILPTMTFSGTGGAQASPPVWVTVSNGIYVDVSLAAGTVAYTVLYRDKDFKYE